MERKLVFATVLFCFILLLLFRGLMNHNSIYAKKEYMHTCMYKKEFIHACSVTKSCPSLCNPLYHSLQALLSMGFSRQEYWSGLPCSVPGDVSTQGLNLRLL